MAAKARDLLDIVTEVLVEPRLDNKERFVQASGQGVLLSLLCRRAGGGCCCRCRCCSCAAAAAPAPAIVACAASVLPLHSAALFAGRGILVDRRQHLAAWTCLQPNQLLFS